jgi:hypothetical protein
MRRIYLASSWLNQLHPSAVIALRKSGHEVFDYREVNGEFHWPPIDTLQDYIRCVETHEPAIAALDRDRDALNWCDTCVLLLPSGRSAHVEFGFAAGAGKDTIVVLDSVEPDAKHELMYLLGRGAGGTRFATSIAELVAALCSISNNNTRLLAEQLARSEMEKIYQLTAAGYDDLVEQIVDGTIDVGSAMQIFDGRRPVE